MEDGEVTPVEKTWLENLRLRLDLSTEEAELLHQTFVREHGRSLTTCPHCQHALRPPSREGNRPPRH